MKTRIFPLVICAMLMAGLHASAQNVKILGANLAQLFPAQTELPGGNVYNIFGQPCSLSYVRQNPWQVYFITGPELWADGMRIDTARLIAPSGRKKMYLCNMPQAEVDTLLNLIFSSPCAENGNRDSLKHAFQTGTPFLYEPELMGNMPANSTRHVSADLNNAFSQLAQPASQLDSIKLVVNYVYALYIYDKRDMVTSTNLDSLAELMEMGILRGQCGDLTHYTNLVITALFPWWGTGVELNSNTDTSQTRCSISHLFLGLANSEGSITTVLDPTVNAVWIDSLNGQPLELGLADSMLLDSTKAWQVTKTYSTFFGRYHTETGPFAQPCVFSMVFSPEAKAELKAYWLATESQDSIWVVKGPWPNFDQQPKYEYYWNQLGFPGKGWVNNLLVIRDGTCYDPQIAALVSRRYRFPVN